MANMDDPGPPSGDGDAGRSQGTALEERVARLESELAALRSQFETKTASPAAAARVAAPPPPPPIPVAHAESVSRSDVARSARPGLEAWDSLPPRTPIAAQAESRESFESQLGSQIFNRIAIVLLLFGTAYALKLAVDRHWIGPTGRVLIGLAAGVGLVLWSERFRHKGFAAFSYSLKAVGSGVLYLSLWAAFQRFHLLPAAAALGLMVLVTAWNAYMAWVQDSELLAAYALAGGFATPLLVSTGGNHEVFLFTYLLAIDIATVALVRLKTWPRLLLGAFPLTVAFFIGWFAQFWELEEPLALTSMFILLFGVAFGSVAVNRAAVEATARFGSLATVLEDILLPLANAAFVALAGYAVLDGSGHHAWLPWLMIVLAAAYLGVMRAPQTRVAAAVHLSLAVVFLTIAVPLKASGHWITVSWLVEGLALLWVATRLAPAEAPEDSAEGYAVTTLRWLAAAALVLGFCGVLVHEFDGLFVSAASYFNGNTGTALTGVAIFAAAAVLSLRAGAVSRDHGWLSTAVVAFAAIDITAILLAGRELLPTEMPGLHAPFQSADFATALTGLAIFAGVIAVTVRLARTHPDAELWTNCAALSTIAFNVIAVLTGVREIVAIWTLSSDAAAGNVDAPLKEALAISAYLMLYGAGLLAAGFWKRNSFLRWQGLALLVFTIGKTFLYDMRNLSQGYRVVSFLGLGALLMAISFAYQKDWLNLRGETGEPSEKAKSEGAR